MFQLVVVVLVLLLVLLLLLLVVVVVVGDQPSFVKTSLRVARQLPTSKVPKLNISNVH